MNDSQWFWFLWHWKRAVNSLTVERGPKVVPHE